MHVGSLKKQQVDLLEVFLNMGLYHGVLVQKLFKLLWLGLLLLWTDVECIQFDREAFKAKCRVNSEAFLV